MSPAEILRAAKAKIEDPVNWLVEEEACDDMGTPVPPADYDACQWCAMGALNAIEWRVNPDYTGPYDYLEQAALEMGFQSKGHLVPPAHLNDTAGHSAVMAMFDRAIALAEQEEGAGR